MQYSVPGDAFGLSIISFEIFLWTTSAESTSELLEEINSAAAAHARDEYAVRPHIMKAYIK